MNNTTTTRKSPFSIFVNQAGYLPDSEKKAVLPFPCEKFTLTDADGRCCYEGNTTSFGYDTNSGDTVTIADFTAITEEGCYRVTADGKTSALFQIGTDTYDRAFDAVSKAFYYLRCGCGLEEQYAGVYKHGSCHTADALLWEDHSVSLDVSGGWHDAGDYGRYVTAGACALAHLLYAYKLFPGAFDHQNLHIPESGSALPDILSECQYELNWLLKMQREDGAVYHKATTAAHAPFVMPEDDTAQMYVLPVSTVATADFAAICALASGIYRSYDPAFADRLCAAAKKTYEWLESHPETEGFKNPEGCGTGEYGERDDNSNRFWAGAEMYALTGETQYHNDMKKYLKFKFPLAALGYTEVGGLGALAYLLCDKEKDSSLVQLFNTAYADEAARLKELSLTCGYGVSLTEDDYKWGSNMTVLKNAMVFILADYLSENDTYRPYAIRQLDYLFGVNAVGFSYVTGIGEFRCNYPHLRPADADGIEECIPGMVSGGPNRTLCDPDAPKFIEQGTPPMKCFADEVGCYSLNEITIYWNSPAVFALAYLKQ